MALKQFGCKPGEEILTDMRAVRKDYFLYHDHSAYVDQWDWERVITPEERNLNFLKDIVRNFLKDIVRKIPKVIYNAGKFAQENWPELKNPKYPDFPEEITFLRAEDILDMYPNLPRKQRETMILQKYPAVFIIGVGWTLKDGHSHEMRAADYDDWVTETVSEDGRPMLGLNGDILVGNPVTRRRHELSSMGIRVTKDTLVKQLEITGQPDFLK
jgi:aspartate--ammonia ligase